MSSTQEQKIDFVIPWVDGSDPAWLAERSLYDGNAIEQGVNTARFRDWGTLKYVLRSIEKYAPWVNHVYLITWGHVPEWLNTEHQKLKVVRHDEFIPKKYLPTFSSHVIELNLHRIPELSEQFVYFNDDMLLNNPLEPEDFFKDGKPLCSGILHIHCVTKDNLIYTICNNNVELINAHFNMKDTLKDVRRWFNPVYGLKELMETTVLTSSPRFPGFRNLHLPNPYLKATFREVWDQEGETLDLTCSHKFREKTDVNQWLMLDWQLASNNFIPTSFHKRGELVDFEKDGSDKEVLRKCLHVLRDPNLKMICINDGDSIQNVDTLQRAVTKMLEEKFPEHSKFEKRLYHMDACPRAMAADSGQPQTPAQEF